MRNVKRADWKIVKKLSTNDQQRLCQLPLIVQPDWLDQDKTLEVNRHIIAKLDILNNYVLDNVQGEFLHLLLNTSNEREVFETYCHIQILEYGIFVKLISLAGELVLDWGYLKIDLDSGETSVDLINRPNCTTEELEKLTKDYVLGVLRTVINLFQYLEVSMVNNDFPIFRQNKLSKSRKHRPHVSRDKQPWKRGDLTSIVFMDALPILSLESAPEPLGGHHASPRYHHRRGHFRTMSHDRYKDNPKFGKPVWYNPCWVGDDSVEVGGTTYTVLHPKQPGE